MSSSDIYVVNDGVRGYRWGLLFPAQESLTGHDGYTGLGSRWRDSVLHRDPDPSACNGSGRLRDLVPYGGGNQRYLRHWPDAKHQGMRAGAVLCDRSYHEGPHVHNWRKAVPGMVAKTTPET